MTKFLGKYMKLNIHSRRLARATRYSATDFCVQLSVNENLDHGSITIISVLGDLTYLLQRLFKILADIFKKRVRSCFFTYEIEMKSMISNVYGGSWDLMKNSGQDALNALMNALLNYLM